jgi:hypothetical protein
MGILTGADTFVRLRAKPSSERQKWWANVKNHHHHVTDFSLILRSENKKAGNDVLPA